MAITLETSVSQLPYIGPLYVKRLRRLGIETVKDLLFHVPHRYDDFSNITPIKNAQLDEKVTIQGKIIEIKSTQTFRKRMNLTEAIINDKTGAIKAVWFNQPYLTNYLSKGQTVSLGGKIKLSKDERIISNPSYEVLQSQNSKTFHTGRLVPVYPETEGLSSKWLRYKIQSLLSLTSKIRDFLPAPIKKSAKLFDLSTALREIHFPQNQAYAKEAKRRLAFDELFLIQLFSISQKKQWQDQKARSIPFPEQYIKDFVSTIPFTLTNAQRVAAWQIFKDLEKHKPMNRILEGDVGSGKTVVATLAALAVIENTFQVAFMAPTEILAKQHFESISTLLSHTNIEIGLITGSETATNFHGKIPKSEFLKSITKEELPIVIGTHALIQDTIKFKKLALVIIDEQHRFGVAQRAILQQQNECVGYAIPDNKIIPHLLTMTATPIPRTLALTIYGDLDLSILNEMPAGRQKIITKIVAPANRLLSYQFIRKQVGEGRQVFVICPRIEATENTEHNNTSSQNSWSSPLAREVKSVEEEYEKLSKKIFPDLRIAKLHGKLKSQEKNEVMSKFKNREFDIIVATSVVEVGIDVPNATVMMIEGAERFGLAQLYQFRGRVGRGEHQSYCFLFTDSTSAVTHKRLKAIVNAKSGFELAEKDLEIRGPGQFLGTRQSGMPDLTMASLNDHTLIREAREQATKILTEDFHLKKYPLLQKELNTFQNRTHFE